MQVNLINWSNDVVGNVSLNEEIFSQPYREDLLHRVVVWQMSKARSGCHKVKQRSEVIGSTKKIYRQKGTGGARHGSKKAPIFVGGGIVFGPVVRDHGFKLNKKVRKLALKVALSAKQANGSIKFVDDISASSPKTSEFVSNAKIISGKKVLIIDVSFDSNVENAVSNLHNIDILKVDGLNVLSIIKADDVIISKDALEAIIKRLS